MKEGMKMVQIMPTHDDFVAITINGVTEELRFIEVVEKYGNQMEVLEAFKNFVATMGQNTMNQNQEMEEKGKAM